MDKDVPNDIRQQRVADVMQEVRSLFMLHAGLSLSFAFCWLFLKAFCHAVSLRQLSFNMVIN